MKRRKGLYTMEDHPVEVFRKGKKKLFVDTVTGQALMHNPKPRRAPKRGIKQRVQGALRGLDQAWAGGGLQALAPELTGADPTAAAMNAKPTTFQKALALEQLEKQRMCQSYHSGRSCSCGAR